MIMTLLPLTTSRTSLLFFAAVSVAYFSLEILAQDHDAISKQLSRRILDRKRKFFTNTGKEILKLDVIPPTERMLYGLDGMMGMSMTYNPVSDPPSYLPSDTAPSSTVPSLVPTSAATPIVSTNAPATAPTMDTIGPVSSSPSSAATEGTSNSPTLSTMAAMTSPPTLIDCPGITEAQRSEQILAILDTVAEPDDIRNVTVPQGQATTWIIEEDIYEVCPDDPNIIQRWTLAVMYYSTGGDNWFKCSASGVDNCGLEDPFLNDERFLSLYHECEWAGISCMDEIVIEFDFDQNNLAGTIPTEIGLLTDLEVLGMQRGNLTGTIPTEVGLLTNLFFLDLNYNELTGTLSSELLSLSSLTQLDLNDNNFSGDINGIGVFPLMEFLQLHSNEFTGTVPEGVSNFGNLATFTLHETLISGTMPQSVCDLVITAGNGGVLGSLIADCSPPNPNIVCDCCTDCRSP